MNVLSTSVPLPLLAIFSHSANANVWTVDCFDQLATQRMDPIKFPGQSEAGHVHAIVGASKFDPDMTYDTLQTSQCNNCNAGDDMSNYWVPQLYIHKQSDGKFHYVPFEFHVYYKLINDCCQTTVNDPNNPNANPIEPGYFSAFPAGFRKVV